MVTYKLYVTDVSRTLTVLKEANVSCVAKDTYVEVTADETQKMEIVKVISAAKIVMLDIE